MCRINIHKFCPFKTTFLIKWNSTIKDCFACYATCSDIGMIFWFIGRIKWMTLHTRNWNHIHICLKSRCHCPHHIIDIKNIYIFIYQYDMFQLCKS